MANHKVKHNVYVIWSLVESGLANTQYILIFILCFVLHRYTVSYLNKEITFMSPVRTPSRSVFAFTFKWRAWWRSIIYKWQLQYNKKYRKILCLPNTVANKDLNASAMALSLSSTHLKIHLKIERGRSCKNNWDSCMVSSIRL